jgi:hypothetical protein
MQLAQICKEGPFSSHVRQNSNDFFSAFANHLKGQHHENHVGYHSEFIAYHLGLLASRLSLNLLRNFGINHIPTVFEEQKTCSNSSKARCVLGGNMVSKRPQASTHTLLKLWENGWLLSCFYCPPSLSFRDKNLWGKTFSQYSTVFLIQYMFN